MLMKIVIALAAIVVVFVAIVATNWEAWNPWAKLDPAMKHTSGGAPAGPGAIYTWAGNNEVGEGRAHKE